MRLTLHLAPSAVVITAPGDLGPYPWLLNVGTLRMAARAGQESGLGVGESPFASVEINNQKRQAAATIGRPLRAKAEIYFDDGALFFAGFVSSIKYGRVMELTIES